MIAGRPGSAGNPAEQICPVCCWAGPAGARCRTCGWQLRGPLVAGYATPFDRRHLAERLTAARRRYDVRAAVRALTSTGERDSQRLSWLANLARGGAPAASELESWAADVDADDRRATASVTGVSYPLIRLVAGQVDAIALLGVEPGGLSVETLVADELGVPRHAPGGASRSWRELVPILSTDPDLCRWQLAGGIGPAGCQPDGPDGLRQNGDPHHADGPAGLAAPAAIQAMLAENMPRELSRLLESAVAAVTTALADRDGRAGVAGGERPVALDPVLVRRTQGWAVLDAASRHARQVVRPVTEIFQPVSGGTLAAVTEGIARRAPLRHAYDLVLVEVRDTDGRVRPYPYTLFPAGAVVRSLARDAWVDVIPPPHAAPELALPVVIRRGEPTAWPLIGSVTISGRATGRTRLYAALDGPGLLRLSTTPTGLGTGGVGPRWPQLLRELPSRLSRQRTVDVVFLVELGGNPANVGRRVGLIRDVVAALATAPESGSIRVGLVGYRDHFGDHRAGAREERRQLLIEHGLQPVIQAQQQLARPGMWQAVRVRDDNGAPVEDALERLANGSTAWRPDARHLVFVVGHRPPHPDRADRWGDKARTCPASLDWRRYIQELRLRQAASIQAVTDAEPKTTRARDIWAELGRRYALSDVDVRQLVQEIGAGANSGVAQLTLAARAATGPGSRGGR